MATMASSMENNMQNN